MGLKIIAVNPGSTSTKLAIYEDTTELWRAAVAHRSEDLARLPRLGDQLEYRRTAVREALAGAPVHGDLAAVVGRGGLLKPLAGGVYQVNDRMKADLASCRYGNHASNLGALIADSLAREEGVKAWIVDPVVVDEMSPLARCSGLPDLPRRSIFHALNQKATARKAAAALGRRYDECTLVVAHLGGGTSVGLHEAGRVVDVNNALDGEGPFAIERAGTLPAGDWLRYILARQHGGIDLQALLTGRGGLVAWLGTNDFPSIEQAAAAWRAGGPAPSGLDGRLCDELISALCYASAKAIAGLAAAVSGRVDAVVLTGGLARSERVVGEIRDRVAFLAPVLVYPGENELEALVLGLLAVLRGETEPRVYEG
ncbi:MAG: butyrate kinase [Spirochaetes bacterium]|nr:butyrate kinase [Spirochaetota bacterium]